MIKKYIFLSLCSLFLVSAAYEEKCVGPLDPNATYKIAAPFDGDYHFTYDKFENGEKSTCFVKVNDIDDAIDFVASQPTQKSFARLKRYIKEQSMPKKNGSKRNH